MQMKQNKMKALEDRRLAAEKAQLDKLAKPDEFGEAWHARMTHVEQPKTQAAAVPTAVTAAEPTAVPAAEPNSSPSKTVSWRARALDSPSTSSPSKTKSNGGKSKARGRVELWFLPLRSVFSARRFAIRVFR